MDFTREPERWVGLLVALGALVPLGLWFVLDKAGPRARAVFGVWSGLMLVIATAVSLLGTVFVGVLLAVPDFTEDDSRGVMVMLALVGLALGLAAAVGLPTLVPDEVAAEEEPSFEEEPPVEEEPPLEADPPTSHWETHTVVSHAPAAVAPVGRATLWVLFLGLALALPLVGLPAVTAASGTFFGDTNGWRVAALLLVGLATALPLLLPALPLRNAPLVAGVFFAVALMHGIGAAWPETFANESWLAFGLGLTAGLLAPTLLRLVGPALAEDGVAVAGGVLLTVALLVAVAACVVRATVEGIQDISTGFGDEQIVVPDGIASVPALPTDFPTFVVPTFVVPTFVVPTFPTFSPVP